MFRDRTNLYLSYRRTIPRVSKETRFDNLEEEESLIGYRKTGKSQHYRDNDGAIEMQNIAPLIFDISQLIDEHLTYIRSKTSDLNALYKKLLITSASDKPGIEKRIENLNYDITKRFEACYVLIKKYDFLQKNYRRLNLDYSNNEVLMIENFKKNYAMKIQNASLTFRNLQNNYIKFLRDDDYDDLNDTSFKVRSSADQEHDVLLQEEETKNIESYSKQVLQESQLQLQTQSNDQMLQQREREISKLAMGILEISTIFKEMESMVVEQGSLLDRIDYNIGNTAQDLKESNKELLKAKSYQQRTTKCKIIFLLSLIVFALVIIVLVKPHGTTKYVQAPSTTPDPKRPAPEHADPAPDNKAPVPERPTIETPDLP